MSKTVEELLAPRYKVVAKYFYSPYQIGDIVFGNDGGRVLLTITSEYSQFMASDMKVENFGHIEILDEYPALFKKLEWWQEREPDEMPEYVKSPDFYDEKKIIVTHVDGKNCRHHFNSEGYFGLKWSTGGGSLAGHFEPATFEEYSQYIAKQKEK